MESEAKGEPMTEPTTIYAPWTAEQVAQLNAWQKRSDRHPFTCGNDSQHYPLVAMRDGWICADCGYRQNWAHSMMTEPKANDHSWYGVPEQLTVCEPTYREGVYLAMSRSETHNMTEPKIPMITRIQLEGLREQITGWRETLNTYPDDAWAHEVCGKTLDAIRLALRALDAEQQIDELTAERDDLKSLVIGLLGELEAANRMPDRACSQCVGDRAIGNGYFTCAYHQAQKVVSWPTK